MRTVRLDEGGVELGHLLVRSVALDAVLSHVAVHGDDLVLHKGVRDRKAGEVQT